MRSGTTIEWCHTGAGRCHTCHTRSSRVSAGEYTKSAKMCHAGSHWGHTGSGSMGHLICVISQGVTEMCHRWNTVLQKTLYCLNIRLRVPLYIRVYGFARKWWATWDTSAYPFEVQGKKRVTPGIACRDTPETHLLAVPGADRRVS